MAGDASFLGTGWSFPPSFGAGGADVEMVSGTEDIEQSLAILLATAPGERVMQEEFGCDLSGFLFAEISQATLSRIRGVVTDAVLHHEPRIDVNDVEVSDARSHEGILLIRIDYTVRATNSRYNLVYPFYVNEASVDAGGQP